jgi:hypothetical protein
MVFVMRMFAIMVFMMGVVMRVLLVIRRSLVWKIWSVIANLGSGLSLRAVGIRRVNDVALNALATATARIAMPGTTAAGTVIRVFFSLAMRTLVGFDQRLTVGDGDLIVVGMNFAERQKAVAIAAILDERRLQRRLHACDFGEIDVAAQLFALRGLEIKLFDAISANHDNPGLFRVGGVDQHFVGHFSTHDGRRRAERPARNAQPGDATVHLIRG